MSDLVDTILENARLAENGGDLDKAVVILRRGLQSKPDDNSMLVALVRVLELSERYADVVEAVHHAESCGNVPAIAYSSLGRSLAELQQFAEAVDAMRKAILLEPRSHRYVLLGSYLEQLGDEGKAIDAYERAVDLDADFDEALCNLGRLLGDLEPARAEALLTRAVELCPEYSVAHRELGQLFAKQGRYEEARSALGVAIGLNSVDTWAYIWLAQVFADLGDIHDAVKCAQKAVNCAEDGEPFAYCKLGDIQKALGDIQAAKLSYQKAIELEPENEVYGIRLEELMGAE